MPWYSHKLMGAILLVAVGAVGVVFNVVMQGTNWALMASCAAVVFIAGAFLAFAHLRGRRGK